ncbi:LLM class flavin-dependent oxidoreductase [Agrobacterium tumefaciens]|uniref:LLM class flavin-dependent oxidoreductase n=1 Tax=Agrobacterium tumefaciens TaxID=358 RepID=UPI0015741CCE|nr:LLM class flavin-dependent oxidoreductase [Agrobacterium tumefaciens]WCK04982.1 LLM class flavin-dependent oxidoreductase [Agrobacterium tumefaciens]
MTFATNFHLSVDLSLRSHDVLGQDSKTDGLLQRLDEGFDLITLEDGFARSTGDGLDAILFANWLGARTSHVGILAGAPINFLEPFHVSTAIATLDYVTEGRAGLLAQPLEGNRAAAARRATGELNGYPENNRQALERDFDEAVDVIRRLWDSWDDDAVIRDPESQRFIDGAKLRYVDFRGANFNVLGPSITPRPPQGQPVIAAIVEPENSTSLASAIDLAFLRAGDSELSSLVKDIKSRHPELRLFADVGFGADWPGKETISQWAADAEAAIATARTLASAGLDGIRLLPREPERDLAPLVERVLPALRNTGLGQARHGSTLRERLSLPVATNRYVVAAA